MVSFARKRMRKVKVRTPGGRVTIHYRKKKSGKHVCALCGGQLHGTPHGKRKADVKKLSKSERRPERAFGGVLCSKCSRKVITEAFMVAKGKKKITDVNATERKFVLQAEKVVGV